MYEHPSFLISNVFDEQKRLDREVERRRAALERLDAQLPPRRTWRQRLGSALRRTTPDVVTAPDAVANPAVVSAVAAGDAVVSDDVANAPVVNATGRSISVVERAVVVADRDDAGSASAEADLDAHAVLAR